MEPIIINLALFAVLGIACTVDVRSRRIPNALTLPTVVIGVVLNTALFGVEGARESVTGLAAGLGMLFPLFLLRWMGAGDVKLMAAVGALKGTEFVFYACLWAAVFGAAIALIGLIRSQRLGLAVAHLYYSRLGTNTGGSFMRGAWRMPYAPAIAMGCMLVLMGVRGLGH
jgi:prepilin peptidase CpaA